MVSFNFCSTYLRFDILRRALEHFAGLRIYQTMNITDIDDKIVAKAKKTGEKPLVMKFDFPRLLMEQGIARKYEEEFCQEMAQLNVLPPERITRVTEFVPEIISFVQVSALENCKWANTHQEHCVAWSCVQHPIGCLFRYHGLWQIRQAARASLS